MMTNGHSCSYLAHCQGVVCARHTPSWTLRFGPRGQPMKMPPEKSDGAWAGQVTIPRLTWPQRRSPPTSGTTALPWSGAGFRPTQRRLLRNTEPHLGHRTRDTHPLGPGTQDATWQASYDWPKAYKQHACGNAAQRMSVSACSLRAARELGAVVRFPRHRTAGDAGRTLTDRHCRPPRQAAVQRRHTLRAATRCEAWRQVRARHGQQDAPYLAL